MNVTPEERRAALATALEGHCLDTMSQDSGQHCICGSDSRFKQRGGDLPWRSIDEHRANVVAPLVEEWLMEATNAVIARVETEIVRQWESREIPKGAFIMVDELRAALRGESLD